MIYLAPNISYHVYGIFGAFQPTITIDTEYYLYPKHLRPENLLTNALS